MTTRELVLHGANGSGSAAIEAALVWLDLPYRVVSGATWRPGPGYQALKRANPLGQVPTLLIPGEPGQADTVLTESAAVLIHLGLAHPSGGLLSTDPLHRARTLRGLVYVVANCYAAIGVIDYPERWLPAASLKPARDRLREGARTRLHGLWDRFADEFCAGSLYLGGDEPDALDLLAAVVSKWSGARGHLKSSRPALHAVFKRTEAHPRVSAVFARHWPPKAAAVH